MLSEEEAGEIKAKIISHIEETFPEEKIEDAVLHIEKMEPHELEKFLEENKILVNNSNKECVFCSIASGLINSVKIDESENAVAVLEINPISKGHAIVIPKKHSDLADNKISEFAEKIAENIKKKFKPRKVEFSKSKIFGHEIISILPIYSNEDFSSEKKHAQFEELEKIKEELEREEKEIPVPIPIEKKEEFLWLPKRIP
jgi:histidine triad (HIT) family protein